MGEGKAGGLRLRFRKRLASLLEKAVISAPPAVPTLPQQAPGSQQLTQLWEGTLLPSPLYLGFSPFRGVPWVVWGSSACILNMCARLRERELGSEGMQDPFPNLCSTSLLYPIAFTFSPNRFN